MKRLFALQSVLAVLLLFFVAVYGARVFEKHVGTRFKLGGPGSTALTERTIAYLRDLRGRVSLTYFVSARSAMPSSMKGVENAVRALHELKKAAPEKVDFRVLDPELDAENGASYASSRGASPIKVRKVLQDESSEQAVWSSLSLAHDQHPDALLQGIRPADLPYLEDWIVENLKAAEDPVQAVIAVSSPPHGFSSMRELVRAYSADQHRDVPPARIITLLSPCDWRTLLQPFGLSFTPLLVLDKNHEEISWKQMDGSFHKVDAPFHLRILPNLFDTKSFLGPNAGALLVSAISPIQIDPQILAASERTAEVVATTSEHARVLDLPAGEFDDALLESADPVAKQPWMVLLKPASEWDGELLVASSSVLFHDDAYAQGGNANAAFFRTLLRTYTHPPRLARTCVPRPEPPQLPPLSLASRVAWRGVTVFLVPAALLVLALRAAGERRRGPARFPWAIHLLTGTAGFVVLVVVTRVWTASWDVRADLTEDSINTPSRVTSRRLGGAREGLKVELLISDSIYMPASLKRLEPRIVRTLRGLGFRPRIFRPEDLSPEEQTSLGTSGVTPFDIETIENDAPVTARVWSALRLRRGEKTETIPQLGPRAAEDLEFLLVAAARRLQGARRPRVGVLSDLPRLSPAEAHADYQQKGYTAPVGSDVYSFVKKILVQHGYDVVYINPDAPVFPPRMDALVWLQPRYPWKVFPQFAKFMNEGGKAIVAVQHYNLQQRQYRGAGFRTVYWPQPQFHSFNDYLQLIGVRQIGDKLADQPGEVLFDRNHADRLLFLWGSRFVLDEALLSQRGIVPVVLVTTSQRSWSYAWSGGWIPEESFTEPQAPALGRQPLGVLLEGSFPPMELKDEKGGRGTLAIPF